VLLVGVGVVVVLLLSLSSLLSLLLLLFVVVGCWLCVPACEENQRVKQRPPLDPRSTQLSPARLQQFPTADELLSPTAAQRTRPT